MSPKLAYKKRTKGVPVKNKDTGRTVYVLPETLKEHPSDFSKVRKERVGDPRWRGKAKPPTRPRKPEKPEVPREPPQAPIKPQDEKKPFTLTEPVPEVPKVKRMKVPEPSPKRRWKKLKKFSPVVTASARAVLRRYLDAMKREA